MKFLNISLFYLLYSAVIVVLPVKACKHRPKDDNMFRPVLTRFVLQQASEFDLNPETYLPVPAMDVPSYTFEVKLHQDCMETDTGAEFLFVNALSESAVAQYHIALKGKKADEFTVDVYSTEGTNEGPQSFRLIKNDTDNSYIIFFLMTKMKEGKSLLLISGDNCASTMANITLRSDTTFASVCRPAGCHASFIGKPTFPGWFTPPIPTFKNKTEDTENAETKRDRETHRKIVEKEHSSFRSSHRRDKREGGKEVCEKCTEELGGDIGKNEAFLSRLSKMTVATQYTMALLVILFGFILFGIMKAWSSSALSLSIIQMMKDDMKTYKSATSQTGTNEKTA